MSHELASETSPVGAGGPDARSRPRASGRDNLVTGLFGTVMSVGGALDAWAHGNLAITDTFLTPWHGVLYAGFAGLACWIGLLILRGHRRGLPWPAAVPVGYGPGVAGVVGFGVGGGLDWIWHTVFGVEVGIEPFLSPTHVLLFVSSVLMVTCPLWAAWSDPASPRAPGFRAFFPTLLSATLLMDTIAFSFLYYLAFVPTFLSAPDKDIQVLLGIATVVITNVILVGTVLLLLRRWRPPLGAVTFLFGYEAVLSNAIAGFGPFPTILTALVGGLAADLLILRLAPSPQRPATVCAVAGLTSLALWGSFVLVAWLVFGLSWSVPLWAGVIAVAVASGVALAVLANPPPVPAGLAEPS